MMMKVSMKTGIKPYTKKDLSVLYELSPRAFYTMFKPHEETVGKKLGRYYSVRQVETIFDKLGLPPCLLKDEYEKPKA
jgi:hypothetical protein